MNRLWKIGEWAGSKKRKEVDNNVLTSEACMKEQDKRAVESLCRCGMSLESVIDSFPHFSKEEIEVVYNSVNKLKPDADEGVGISINCS